MYAQEAKRNQIIDLLDANTPQKEIAKIVDVSERTVRPIQHAKKLVRGTKRFSGSRVPTGREARSFSRLSSTKSRRILVTDFVRKS